MKVVIDTNVFISCIGKKSLYRNVFDAFLNERYTLCVTSEILLEYEEKFTEFWSAEVADNLLRRLMLGPNISLHNIYFNFALAGKDPDDNKFSDAFLVSGADYLVSNDTVLLSLNKSPFPKMNVITVEEFSFLLKAAKE